MSSSESWEGKEMEMGFFDWRERVQKREAVAAPRAKAAAYLIIKI